ncbi:SDR family oxidoreductase [Labrys monachus]|uniref:NAD(P)-dependent dehydrogenase (Short-subunit alcohol dehydrogenase family) n=1 Tax=Labrys monachus TaxID=217067 RepID=A0ABU0FIM0_9HYPH|nr:SDR family oxidoreductase [Labrys monachus]MDQ0394356.1 NAD(P)-dependent dehydrogenase (short-subunit alcohol dehydrogenase family) [Labrys monachus]
MDLGLAGKRVLVTGASQGIGSGLARAFASEGCHVELTARSADKLQAIEREIRAAGGTAGVHPLDLAQPGAAQALAEAVGDVDILINNAGVIPSGSLFDIDEARWRAGWELKVYGYINLCRLYYPRMKAQGGGVILNNIGNGGEIADPQYIAGAMGNASLMAFTRAIGGTSLNDNIRVVGVNPGPVDTDRIYAMLRKRARDMFGDEERYRELEALYPLKRPAKVHEVVDLFLFLASYRSGYTSGTIMTVDGGIASRRSIV